MAGNVDGDGDKERQRREEDKMALDVTELL
jgi:hypothetical protein